MNYYLEPGHPALVSLVHSAAADWVHCSVLQLMGCTVVPGHSVDSPLGHPHPQLQPSAGTILLPLLSTSDLEHHVLSCVGMLLLPLQASGTVAQQGDHHEDQPPPAYNGGHHLLALELDT